MDYFTSRNAAILGLVQVGVIVAGVLGAGAAHKWAAQTGIALPWISKFVCEYGFLALVVPIVWTAIALYVLNRWGKEEGTTAAVFIVGLGGVLVLAIYAFQAALLPVFRLLGW